MFSLTNFQDLKDIDEDISNNIQTLPVIFGSAMTRNVILLSAGLSIYYFTQLDNFHWTLPNLLFMTSSLAPLSAILGNVTLH